MPCVVAVTREPVQDASLRFLVKVREDASETVHRVTMSEDMLRRLVPDAHVPEHFVEAAFGFLLDREPKESILRSFDISVISRYFPEFEHALPDYLARSGR